MTLKAYLESGSTVPLIQSQLVAWWLATRARKPEVPVRVRLPAMCRGKLSAVTARLISKCL